MKTRFIEGEHNSPSILLDAEQHLLKITGRSYPEDTERIYTPVIQWLEEFATESKASDFKCVFDLDFINSISHKRLWQILTILKAWEESDKKISVLWFFPSDDEDLMDAGEDLARLSGLNFEIIAKEQTNDDEQL